MNEPDFSRYDAQQLRQVLGRIDRERFPERAAAAEAILAQRERDGDNGCAAERAGSQAQVADPASYAPVMRRVALVLVAVGLVELGRTIWLSLQAHAFSAYLGVPLVLGLLLSTGSLRVAAVVRWLGCLILPLTIATMLMAYAIPLDLLQVELRLAPWQFVGNALLSMASVALMAWVVHQLGSPGIAAARALEGRRTVDLRIALALGVVLAAGIQGWLYQALTGPLAAHAEQLAVAQVAAPQPGANPYSFRVVQLHQLSAPSGTRYQAMVQVWNHDGIGYVMVNWQDEK